MLILSVSLTSANVQSKMIHKKEGTMVEIPDVISSNGVTFVINKVLVPMAKRD